MNDKTSTSTTSVPAAAGQPERYVGRPAPERAEWAHLQRYGYAPGNYMTRCRRCQQIVTDVDKRAIACLPCSEEMHKEKA